MGKEDTHGQSSHSILDMDTGEKLPLLTSSEFGHAQMYSREGYWIISQDGCKRYFKIEDRSIKGCFWDTKPFFEEGLSPVQTEGPHDLYGGLWGYIDTNIDVVIDFQFIDAGYFEDGLATVVIDKDKYENPISAQIDKQGNIQ